MNDDCATCDAPAPAFTLDEATEILREKMHAAMARFERVPGDESFQDLELAMTCYKAVARAARRER